MSHRNALLTPTGRLRLARCVVDDGWPLRRAAERFNVSVTTARRWAERYRRYGADAMEDRSSRPHRPAGQTPRRRERRIIGLRVSRRWGPARIAYHLGMHPSTVHRVLTRYHCVKLSWTDPATGRRCAPHDATSCDTNTPRPGTWFTSTSRNWGASPTVVATASTAARSGATIVGRIPPVPRPGTEWATPTSTMPWTVTPGTCTARSSPMSEKRPRSVRH